MAQLSGVRLHLGSPARDAPLRMPILGANQARRAGRPRHKEESQTAKRESGASEDAIDFVDETDNNFDVAVIAS